MLNWTYHPDIKHECKKRTAGSNMPFKFGIFTIFIYFATRNVLSFASQTKNEIENRSINQWSTARSAICRGFSMEQNGHRKLNGQNNRVRAALIEKDKSHFCGRTCANLWPATHPPHNLCLISRLIYSKIIFCYLSKSAGPVDALLPAALSYRIRAQMLQQIWKWKSTLFIGRGSFFRFVLGVDLMREGWKRKGNV